MARKLVDSGSRLTTTTYFTWADDVEQLLEMGMREGTRALNLSGTPSSESTQELAICLAHGKTTDRTADTSARVPLDHHCVLFTLGPIRHRSPARCKRRHHRLPGCSLHADRRFLQFGNVVLRQCFQQTRAPIRGRRCRDRRAQHALVLVAGVVRTHYANSCN